MAEKVYTIKNVVRRVQTRLRRASAPGRLRFKQMIGGRRLLRNQSMSFTEAQFEAVKADVMRGLAAGALEMTDPAGWLYFVDATGKLAKRKAGEVQTLDGQVTKAAPPPPKKEPAAAAPPPPPAEKPAAPPPPPPPPPKKDDLTSLPGVGGGRVKKLEAAGINTFKQLAEMAPGKLVKVLGPPLTEDQAAEICDAASEKEG